MIIISVKSEVVDDKRQFKSDRKALTFLKRIKSLHDNHRLQIAGPKPKRIKGKNSGRINKDRLDRWNRYSKIMHQSSYRNN